MGHLSTIDGLIVLIYILAILWLGFRLSRTHENSEDYFLAGRAMGWPLIGISLFASNISSTTLVGLSGFSYANNISVYNYEWMAAVVLVIFAWFFLPYYLRTRIYTVPEFLEKRFDCRTRYIFSVLTLFLNIVVDTAGSLYAGGLVIKLIFPDTELWQIVAVLAFTAGIYTVAGGLKAVIYTDVVQAVLLVFGSVVICLMALHTVGGWEAISQSIPADDLSLIRPLDDPNMPWLGLVTGVFLIGFYFWGMNQFIVQRMLSAKDIHHGRMGAIFAGFLKLPVIFVMVMPGILARYLYPELENPDQVFPTLMFDLLPVGLLGLVLAGLLAALMSSIDSTLNSASTLVTMDFIHKLKPQLNDEQLMWVGRGVTIVFMVLAVLWAPQIENFQNLFNYLQHVLSYAVSPVVAVLVLGVFWRGMNANAAFYAIVAGLILGLALYATNVVLSITAIHFLYIAPILFLFSVGVSVLVSLLTRERYRETSSELVWSKADFNRDTHELHRLPWYKNYRICSYLLILCTMAIIVLFW